MNVRMIACITVVLGLLATTCDAARAVGAYPVPIATPIFPADMGTLTVTSTTFPNGGTVPVANAGTGCGGKNGTAENVSPQLSWTAGPAGTAMYVVTIFDVDNPSGSGFWHWLVFNIPPNVTSLPLDAAAKNLPAGAIQGYNDGGATGYRGPCPPPGDPPHRYYITVSAMNVVFGPTYGPGTTGGRVGFLMSRGGKVLARGQYLGLYGQ